MRGWDSQRVELFLCRRCWDEDGLMPQVGPWVCLHGEDGKEEVEAESVGWYVREDLVPKKWLDSERQVNAELSKMLRECEAGVDRPTP